MRVEVFCGSVVLEFQFQAEKKKKKIEETADLLADFLFEIVFVCETG